MSTTELVAQTTDAEPNGSPDHWLEEQRLKAKLVEYEQLKSEIKGRSDFQQRLIQLHMTALVAILAAALSESLSRWIILLIPVESAIFGMWWMDHAGSIRDIGGYIASHHEKYIDSLLKERNVMGWERRHRSDGAETYDSWWERVRYMHRWTFLYLPIAIAALTLCAAVATLPDLLKPNWGWVESLERGVHQALPMANTYEGWKPLVLAIWFLIHVVVLRKFVESDASYRELVREQQAEYAHHDTSTSRVKA